MKKLKLFKILDLVMSIMFFVMFLYKYRITESYEYGLVQMITIFIMIPIIILLFVSIIMAILSLIFKDSNIYSVTGQILKIIAFIVYIIISSLLLPVKLKIDFVFIIPIFGIIGIIILYIDKLKNKKTV